MRWDQPSAAMTTHGARRFRQRVKLPARAAARQIARVRSEGLRREQLTGAARVKLDTIIKRYEDRERPAEYLVYRNFLYIFDAENGVLITVYPLL